MLQQPVATDMLFLQQTGHLFAGFVAANDAQEVGRGFQRRQIAGHVGRAAGHEILALKIHHRHGRLRRNARDTAPDELVQHHIADDQHVAPARKG